MRHQTHSYGARIPVDAAQQVAKLRHVLGLIGALAGGGEAPADEDVALDEAARVASAFQEAEPVVQRRFGILAAEITAWSSAGVEALLEAGDRRSPAAARQLADELANGINELSVLLQLEAVPEAPEERLLTWAIPST